VTDGQGAPEAPKIRRDWLLEPDEPPADRAPLKRDAVRIIRKLMSRLMWVRGVTARELAARWKKPLSTVESWASEAHNQLIEDSGALDDQRRDLLLGAADIIRDARRDARELRALGKRRDAAACERNAIMMIRILHYAATRAEADNPDEMSDDELAELLTRKLARKGRSDEP